jgi:hypothetical protein
LAWSVLDDACLAEGKLDLAKGIAQRPGVVIA